jgi:hypothetical protein
MGSNVSIDVGDVLYGCSVTRRIQIYPDGDPDLAVRKIRYLGCGACTNTRIDSDRSASMGNGYELVLQFNTRHARRPELGEYVDQFVVASDSEAIGTIKVKHTTALSRDVTPNKLSVPNAKPGDTVHVAINKTRAFVTSSVEPRIAGASVIDWLDRGDTVQVALRIGHTFSNGIVRGDLLVACGEGRQIVLPLRIEILEDTIVEPRSIILGAVRQGETVRSQIKLRSSKQISVDQSRSGDDGVCWTYSEHGAREGNLLLEVPIPEDAPLGEYAKTVLIPLRKGLAVPIDVRAIVVRPSQSIPSCPG